jgi:hypothetical protein
MCNLDFWEKPRVWQLLMFLPSLHFPHLSVENVSRADSTFYDSLIPPPTFQAERNSHLSEKGKAASFFTLTALCFAAK